MSHYGFNMFKRRYCGNNWVKNRRLKGWGVCWKNSALSPAEGRHTVPWTHQGHQSVNTATVSLKSAHLLKTQMQFASLRVINMRSSYAFTFPLSHITCATSRIKLIVRKDQGDIFQSYKKIKNIKLRQESHFTWCKFAKSTKRFNKQMVLWVLSDMTDQSVQMVTGCDNFEVTWGDISKSMPQAQGAYFIQDVRVAFTTCL